MNSHARVRLGGQGPWVRELAEEDNELVDHVNLYLVYAKVNKCNVCAQKTIHDMLPAHGRRKRPFFLGGVGAVLLYHGHAILG